VFKLAGTPWNSIDGLWMPTTLAMRPLFQSIGLEQRRVRWKQRHDDAAFENRLRLIGRIRRRGWRGHALRRRSGRQL
jgi:hypothetical protein